MSRINIIIKIFNLENNIVNKLILINKLKSNTFKLIK